MQILKVKNLGKQINRKVLLFCNRNQVNAEFLSSQNTFFLVFQICIQTYSWDSPAAAIPIQLLSRSGYVTQTMEGNLLSCILVFCLFCLNKIRLRADVVRELLNDLAQDVFENESFFYYFTAIAQYNNEMGLELITLNLCVNMCENLNFGIIQFNFERPQYNKQAS